MEYARGGLITGPGDPTKLMAALDSGYVLPARVVRELGLGRNLLAELNARAAKAPMHEAPPHTSPQQLSGHSSPQPTTPTPS